MNTNRLTGTQQERPDYEFLQNVRVDGDVEVLGDITVDDITIDDLTCNDILTNTIAGRTTSTELSLLGSTITSSNVGHVASLNQDLSTSDSVEFSSVSTPLINGDGMNPLTIDPLGDSLIVSGDVDIEGRLAIKNGGTLSFENITQEMVPVNASVNYTGSSCDLIVVDIGDTGGGTRLFGVGDTTTKQGLFIGDNTSSGFMPMLFNSIAYSSAASGGSGAGSSDTNDCAYSWYALRNGATTDSGTAPLCIWNFARRENNATSISAITNRALFRIDNANSQRLLLDKNGNLAISGGLTCGTVSCSDITSNSETTYQLTVSPLGNGTVRLPSYDNAAESSLTPAAGDLYFNTDLAKMKIYTGSGWETVSSA